MPVALVVLDAFPFDAVDARTPTLLGLAAEGGWRADGGIGDLTAATYPNHVSLVTGRPTADHGVVANHVLRDGAWVGAGLVGPGDDHLLAAATRCARRSVFVAGDQNLVGVCGGRSASAHWPPDGIAPDGAERNATGYLADDEVVAAAHRLDIAGADLVVAQLDSVDAAQHVFGPSSDEASDQYRATDLALGALLEPLRSAWRDWVVCVVSDHGQEDLSAEPAVDLRHELARALGAERAAVLDVRDQGTAAVVVGAVTPTELVTADGVEGVRRITDDTHVVWGGPGRYFGAHDPVHRGDHGSARTRRQLAVVGGGHPHARSIAARLAARPPRVTDWAGWVADAAGLPWRPATTTSPTTSTSPTALEPI